LKSRQIDQSPKTFILVFETGDELAKGLLEFANQEKLSAASFKAVGALSSLRLGWFSWESKKYKPSVTLDEQVELLSLIYTDGITDVFNSRGEMLGVSGIQEIVRQTSSLPGDEIKQGILDAVAALRSGPPTDDVGLMLVHVRGHD
jgi:hypothetical protein